MKSTVELYTVEGFEDMVRMLIDGPLKAELPYGLEPKAIIIGTKDPTTGLAEPEPRVNLIGAPPDFNNPDNKDVFVSMVKQIGEQVDAIAVAFFSEAWMVQFTKGAKLSELPTSIADHPDRQQMVMIHLEHIGYTGSLTKAWRAPIIEEVVDGKIINRTLGELDTEFGSASAGGVNGRFSGMLPQRGHTYKA